jgi:hypothetical protein
MVIVLETPALPVGTPQKRERFSHHQTGFRGAQRHAGLRIPLRAWPSAACLAATVCRIKKVQREPRATERHLRALGAGWATVR